MISLNFENKRILIDTISGKEYRLHLEKFTSDYPLLATVELYESIFSSRILLGKLLIIRLVLDKNTIGNDSSLDDNGACHCAFISDITFSVDFLHEVLNEFLNSFYKEFRISFAVLLCKEKYFRVCIPIYSVITGGLLDSTNNLLWKTVQRDPSHAKLFKSQMNEDTFWLIERACEEVIMTTDENVIIFREGEKYFYIAFKDERDETRENYLRIANTLPVGRVLMVPDYFFSSEMELSDHHPILYQVKYPCHSLGEIRMLRLPLL